MDPTQAVMYELVKWCFSALFSSQMATIAGPFFILLMLLRFINWTRATAKGETAGSLADDMSDLRARAGTAQDHLHRAQGKYGPYPNRTSPRRSGRRRP